MENVEKLWKLWESKNYILCIELIESQNLDLTNVLLEFWERYTPNETFNSWKGIKFCYQDNIIYVIYDNDCYRLHINDDEVKYYTIPRRERLITSYCWAEDELDIFPSFDECKEAVFLDFKMTIINIINEDG